MDCAEARSLINAYADGELPLERGLELEHHLAGCAACAEGLAARRALGEALRREASYFRAPPDLRRAVLAELDRAEPRRRPRATPPQWLRLAASFLLVAGLSSALTYYATPKGASLGDEVFASHIRGVQSENRLIDVPSSDEHTVKPWFTDKLDYSPPVKDLGAEGFPLVGGRLDYIAGRTVAALVYRHGKHVITLFIWPSKAPASGIEASMRRGDNLAHWSDGAMTYWAVSDVATPEFLEFARLFRTAGTSAEPAGPAPPKK